MSPINCGYYIDNWFYGYQTYCSGIKTEYWLNMGGYMLLGVMTALLIRAYLRYIPIPSVCKP